MSDTCTIWSNFVFARVYIKIGHCPIVRLSIVMRAVSQCSVIINHAFAFCHCLHPMIHSHLTLHSSANKFGEIIPSFSFQSEVGCKMKKLFGICRFLKLQPRRLEQLQILIENKSFQSICILPCPKTLLIAATFSAA